MIDALSDLTVMFAFALALALLVERLLEVLKSLYDVLDSRLNWYHFWSRRTRVLRDQVERRLRVFEYVNPDAARPVLNRVYQLLLNNQAGYTGGEGGGGTALVLSGDLVRAAGVRVACKLVGMAVGVGLALWLKIDFVQLWQPPGGIPYLWASPELCTVASGMAIGLGAGPVHKIIVAIEKQRAAKEHPTS
jgi:hypothetical protein